MVYKLFKEVAGATEASATLDIREDDTLTGVLFDLSASGTLGNNINVEAELSFISTSQFEVNDTNGVICAQRLQFSFTTSGATVAGVPVFIPMNLSVAGGERMYLHVKSDTANVNVTAQVFMYTGKAGTRRAVTRR